MLEKSGKTALSGGTSHTTVGALSYTAVLIRVITPAAFFSKLTSPHLSNQTFGIAVCILEFSDSRHHPLLDFASFHAFCTDTPSSTKNLY